MKNISSDSSTLAALKIFVQNGYVSNENQLIDTLSTVSSCSIKSEIAIILSDRIESISYHDAFCKLLALAINDQDYYLKVTNKLNLNEEYVQKYKPEKKTFNFDDIDFGSHDISIPNGVNCISHSIMTNGDTRHEIKKFSNGMVIENRYVNNGGMSRTVTYEKNNSSFFNYF